jgi:hypothetical protein
MPFRFNMLLEEAGLDPADVRLLRHQADLPSQRSLFDWWHQDRPAFEAYQSLQLNSKRASFARPHWAAFLGTWDGRTMFAGIYQVGSPSLLDHEVEAPISGDRFPAGTIDRYETRFTSLLSPYSGRLYIDWGGGASGKRAWSQRADLQDKLVTELHLDAAERPFPGLMEIALPLSSIAEAPPSWIQRLAEARGIYLLTCPRTGELYVGSATAAGGFWSRWSEYAANGHGGNVALVDRGPADWIVSILQVAGSAHTGDDIPAMEQVWKRKLQSRELGLNRN